MKETDTLSEPTIETVFTNPYPGLRPFNTSESDLYFGREDQVNEVLERIRKNHFIAVIGNSGIGKSSFINCGIIPELKKDDDWEVLAFRPGSTPLVEIYNLFCTHLANTEPDPHSSGFYSTDLYIHMLEHYFASSKNKVLIYIDQFEETFRYNSNDKDAETQIRFFIDLLVAISYRRELPVHVAITMRSDYIGECSRFPKLTSLINDSQFLIPQMTREEIKRAIVKPCEHFNYKINSDLIEQMLDSIGNENDILPVMQHALMRTWENWKKNRIGDEEIGLTHYEAIGGIEKALSIHANEVFNELDDNLKPICEKCFKTITEKGEEERSYRRPAKVWELAEITQAPNHQIIDIVEEFRKPGNTILTPSTDDELNAESIVDVSHESIMRVWETLTKWMEEEYESTKQYLRIAEAAQMHQEGKGTLLKSPELQMATNWYHLAQPTKTWGIRHDVAFDRTIEFLLYSEKQFLREERLKTVQQKRRLIVARAIALVFGTGALVAGLLVVYAIRQRNEVTQQKTFAEQQTVRAEQQTVIANKNAKEAQIQTKKALVKEREANISRSKAEEERQNALEQTKIAQVAEKKALYEEQQAMRLRMFSIARSMAVKSLQENDIITKSLVARQAYNFYIENGGAGTDPDIYNALYYSVKELKGKDFSSLPGHQDNVRSIATSSNFKHFYSCSSDGKIIKRIPGKDFDYKTETIWNSEKLVHMCMAASDDGKYLVTGGRYDFLLLFDISNPNKKPKKIKASTSQIPFVKFTSNSKNILFVDDNNNVLSYNFDEITTIVKAQNRINTFDVNKNGTHVAIGEDSGEVIQYNITTGDSLLLYQSYNNKAITSIKYSNENNMMAIGLMNGIVKVISTKDLSEIATLTGHTARVNNICFNNSSSQIASASFDHTVRIWDVDNILNSPVILTDHKDWVWSIGFSSDDKYLYAGCRDKLVRSWIMDINYLAKAVCNDDKINRQLTEKEWNNYVGQDVERTCSCIGKCND